VCVSVCVCVYTVHRIVVLDLGETY
jgi:hypothetical protein